MCCNFSFYIAFLLLVHMTPAILTGASNGEDFNINKVELSSLESIEEKDDKPVLHNVLRSKRGYDYSDFSSESSEENFGYYHKPQYIGSPSHWPHHFQRPSLPTPHTSGYGQWQPGPSRPPYYHGKYHVYFHDKKCKYPLYNSGEYEDSNSNEQTEKPEITTPKTLPDNINNMPPITNNPITPSIATSTETPTEIPASTSSTTADYGPLINIRSRE